MQLSSIAASFLATLWGVCVLVGTAEAQMGIGGGATLTPPPVATGREDVFAAPARARSAMAVGDWLLYPTAFGGVSYDSNVNQAAAGARSSAGLRMVPSLLAEYNNGISKLDLYGVADGRIYTNQGAGASDVLSARVGASESWSPTPDWILTGVGDYTRRRDLFSQLATTGATPALNPSGIGLAPTVNPQTYNQFTGIASAQKNFANAFAIVSGSVVDLAYERSRGTTAPSPDGATYAGTLRGGNWVTPAIYTYLEGSLELHDFATSSLSSTGYRVVGGLGSDQIGLFRGEIYGGYHADSYRSGAIGTVSTPVFGGRIYYYPLPELTISTAVDRTLGASLLVAAAASAAGSATQVTSAVTRADYAFAPEWTAAAIGGYVHTDYVRSVRQDDGWTLGSTLTYSVWQNFGLTLDYQHVELVSNAVLQSFSRDVVTLGVSYKY
jgi:hypothetical protein